MIEVIKIDGVKVSMAGDYYETLIYLDLDGRKLLEYLSENVETDEILLLGDSGKQFIEVKAQRFLAEEIVAVLGRAASGVVKGHKFSSVFRMVHV